MIRPLLPRTRRTKKEENILLFLIWFSYLHFFSPSWLIHNRTLEKMVIYNYLMAYWKPQIIRTFNKREILCNILLLFLKKADYTRDYFIITRLKNNADFVAYVCVRMIEKKDKKRTQWIATENRGLISFVRVLISIERATNNCKCV